MSKLTLGKLSSSERSLTDKLTELDLDKGWLPPTLSLKKPLIPPKSQSRVSRELLLLTSDAKTKYLNDNDRLMFKVYYEKSGDKENHNTKNSNGNTGSSTELILSEESLLSYLANLVHFLGRNKLELERELASQKNDQLSQYEIHLQRLEAQIREHIRIEQQLKLYAESLQAKVDDFHRKEANQEQNHSSSERDRGHNEGEQNLSSGGHQRNQELSNTAPLNQVLIRQAESKDKFCMTAEFPNGLAGRVPTLGTATTQSQTAGCHTVSNLGCGGHFLPRNSSSPVITTVGSGYATGKDHFSNSELQEAMEAMCDKIRLLEDENLKRREEIQLRDAKIEALEDENKSLKVRMDKMKGLLGNQGLKSQKGSNVPSWAAPIENSNSKFGDTMPAANQPEPIVLNYAISAANKRNKGRGNRMSNIEELIHGKKDSIFGTTHDLTAGPNNRSVSNEKVKENSLHQKHMLKQMLHKVGNGSFSDLNREKMLSAKLVKTNRPGTSIKDPRLLFDRKVSNKKSCKKKEDTCRIEVKVNPFMTSDARNGLLMRSGDFSKPRGIGYRSQSIDAAGKKLPKEKRKRTPDYSVSFLNTASGKTMLKAIGEQFSHLKSLRAHQSLSGGDKLKGLRPPAPKT